MRLAQVTTALRLPSLTSSIWRTVALHSGQQFARSAHFCMQAKWKRCTQPSSNAYDLPSIASQQIAQSSVARASGENRGTFGGTFSSGTQRLMLLAAESRRHCGCMACKCRGEGLRPSRARPGDAPRCRPPRDITSGAAGAAGNAGRGTRCASATRAPSGKVRPVLLA